MFQTFDNFNELSVIVKLRQAQAHWWKFLKMSHSGVATGGSGGSMNRGPRAPGGPRATPQKIKHNNLKLS